MKRIFNLLTILFFLPFFGTGQQMPTSATVILNAPHPVFVYEYYALGSNALQGLIVLNDFNEPSWDVRIRVSIEGEGIKIRTKQSFVPLNPINLTPGIPLLMEGSDFSQYLDINNVDLEGISAATLSQSGKLPEGIYNFCIEVYDYVSGVQLSLSSCASAFIFFEPPPVTLLPDCEAVVVPSDPQNVFFSWQIAGGASPTIAMNSKYQLSLYEVTDINEDAYFAVANNHALLVYESDFINQTSMSIDFGITSTTLLTPGKKYVYRVRAVDGDEKDIYKNNGFSEWCWFFYGYPSDGVISTTAPEDEHIFGKFENKTFNWEVSNLGIPGQEYNYTAVIKELNEDQNKEDAMMSNPEWYVKNMPTTSSLNGYGFTLEQATEPGTTYIWQVTAYTGPQEVAKSEVFTFYSAPLVDKFYAGSNLVKVVSLSNTDLSNFSGVGRVQISDDENDIVEFEFEGFSLQEVGSKYIVTAGQVIFDILKDPLVIESSLVENGPANLNLTKGKLTSGGLQILGQLEWDFPHATTDGAQSKITSEEKWLDLNSSFQFVGQLSIDELSEYELLEPFEFKISLIETTSFLLQNNKFTLSLNGSLSANDNVRTNDNNNYKLPFYSQPSLYYFEANSLINASTNYIEPAANFNVGFEPNKAIIDLSENESPGELSGDVSWKGVYFSEYLVRFYADQTDKTNQLIIESDIEITSHLNDKEFWFSKNGLHLVYDYEFNQEGTTFNGFSTTIAGNFKIEDNQITNSKITGEIQIPVIDKVDGFEFEIPVTNDGLAQGYLIEDLTLRDMAFNPYGGENRVNISINRAVFADNERIDLEIDAELVGIGATVSGITDFRIYGDNTIGVGSKGGSKALDTQVEGEYKGFATYVQEVGAALFNGNYVFSYVAALDMGADVVGEDGPPLLAISSVEEVGSDVVLPDFGPTNPQPEPTISVPADVEPGETTLTTYEMFIAIDNAIVDLEGYLKLTNNDPNWGTSFRGGINGELKIPTKIEVGANMIFGDKDGVKFWYFDAYFNDREGLGVAVPPFFNLVAMEGKIYHHMSKNETEYVVDETMAFGAGLYMQLIDNQTGGLLFAIDAGAEIKIKESGDFTLSMSGDGSFINKNKRSGGSGSISAAAGEVIAEEALEAIGPISLTYSIGGGELTIEAEGLTKGSLNYVKGGMEFGFGADFSSTPGIEFNYSNGGGSIEFNADASGEFGVGFGLNGNELSLGIAGSNGGYLDLSYGDVSFATRVNRSNKTGSLAFTYGDKSIDLGVETGGGHLNLALSEDLMFETGFSTSGSANFGFKVGANEFSLSGDKTSGAGLFDLNVDGLSMNTAVNVKDKSASFGLSTSGFTIALSGDYGTGGSFLLDAGGEKYDVAVNLDEKTGHIDLVNGDNRMFAELTSNGQGALLLKNGGQEFGISGNTAGTAGSVHFKDNTAEFTVAADKTAKTGLIHLGYGDNLISSGVSSDSSYVHLAYSDVLFKVQTNNSSSGVLEMKEGSNHIKIAANTEDKSGSLLLTNGTDKIYASGAANGTGGIDLDINNNIIKGELGETNSSLFVSSGNYEFNIEGDKDGNGTIGLKSGSVETRLGINVPESAGEIYVGNGNDFIHIKGNKTKNTGLIDLKASAVEFTAILDDSLYMKTGPVSLTKFSDGTGHLKYFNAGQGVSVFKNQNEIGLGLDYSGTSLYLIHGTSASFDSVYYKGSGQTAYASMSGTSGRLGFSNASGSFGLSANANGSGAISFDQGGVKIDLTGDVTNKSGSFDFEKGDLKLKGNASISDKTFDIDFEKSNIASNLSYEPTLQKISFELSGNFSIEAQKENDTYLTIFKKGDHELKGTTSSSLKELEYNGMGAKVILGTDREFVSYGSHSVLIQNKKVTIDGQEAYDFASSQLADINWSQTMTYGDVTITPSVIGSNVAISVISGSDSIQVKVAGSTGGGIYGYIAGKNISFSKDGSDYELAYESYSAELKSGNFKIKNGTNNELNLSSTGGSVKYDNYEVSVSSTDGFNYSDGTNSTGINSGGISAKSGVKEISYNTAKELFIQYESGKNFKIHPQNGLEVNYDGKTMTVSEELLSYSDDSRSYAVSPTELSIKEGDKELIINESRGYLAYDSQNSLEFKDGVLTAINSDKTFTISDEKQITFNDPNRALAISPDGMSLSLDGKSVSISADEMEIILAEDQKLKLTDNLLELQYLSNEIKLGSSALYFTNGEQTVDLSKDNLELSSGDKGIYFGANSFGLNYGDNKSLNIDRENQSVSFKYNEIETSFSNGESLSFTDGTRSFEVGTTGLSMSEGERGIAIVNENNTQALELTSGDDRFYVSNSGFSIDYLGKHFAVNEEEYLRVDIDDNRYIEVTNNSAKYSDNGTELIIGGDDNFLELTTGTKSIALTQDEKIEYVDGQYVASLSKDLEIYLTDGTRTLGLFTPTHYVSYEEDNYKFGIRGKGDSKPGIDITANGHTLFVEGERNKGVTVGVSSPGFGEVSFAVNSDKDIEARFKNGSSVYGFIKDETGITAITGTEPAPPEADYLEGSGTVVAMDGPTYLTNSVADEGGGSIRGKMELSFDSKTKHFVANAAVKGNQPVCIEGAMAIDVSPERFKLDIGTEAQKIEIYPTCSGFGGGGWFGLESTSASTSIDFGVFVGWKAGASIEIGSDVVGAGLSCSASAELGVRAKADLLPSFKLKEAGIWVSLYAGISAKYWAVGISGSITIASISLNGNLLAKFLENETQVSGSLDGSITILDIITESFAMSFDTKF